MRLESRIRGAVAAVNQWSMLTPTTFYLLTANEVSSRGYASFLEFYEYVREMWTRFVRFWIDRVFYHDPGEIVNFLQKDENIFRSRSHLPAYITTGLLILLGYVVAGFFLSYSRYRLWLYPGPVEASAFAGLSVIFSAGAPNSIVTNRPEFIWQVLNEFYGRGRGLPWQVVLAGKRLLGKVKQDFFLVPTIHQVPGEYKVKHLYCFYRDWYAAPAERSAGARAALAKVGTGLLEKRFGELDDLEKARVLLILARLAAAPVYILAEFAFSLIPCLHHELKDYLEPLLENNRTLIDLSTTNPCMAVEPVKYYNFNKAENKYEAK